MSTSGLYWPADVATVEEDDTQSEFYENIWGRKRPTRDVHSSVKDKKRRKASATPYIDISQVAHVLTSVNEYRQEYPPLEMHDANFWLLTPPAAPRDSNEVAPDTDPQEIMSPILSDGHTAFEDDDLSSRQNLTELSLEELEKPHSDLDEVSEYTLSGEDEKTAPLEMHEESPTSSKNDFLKSSMSSAVPPPSTKDGSVIFSVVFTQQQEWSWASRFLLGFHEPVRHALFVMDNFLEQSHELQQLQALETHVREFFAWFRSYFVEYLTCQYELKTTVLHPLLPLKYSTKLEVAKTYEEVEDMLRQVQRQQAVLCPLGDSDPSAWLAKLDDLQGLIRRLNMTLHAVLNLEEKTLHAALCATFTQETFQKYVMPRIFRGIKAKRLVVPWILERSRAWGGEAEHQSIQDMMPLPARFLYRRVWQPYFTSNVASTMKTLRENTDSQVEAPADPAPRQGDLCTIQ